MSKRKNEDYIISTIIPTASYIGADITTVSDLGLYVFTGSDQWVFGEKYVRFDIFISLIHTFVNIPALFRKRSVFLSSRAGIITEV